MKELADFGLVAGETVRFRRRPGERWKSATVKGVERDDSIKLSDAKGASRSIPIDLIEHIEFGPRGARHWVPLTSKT